MALLILGLALFFIPHLISSITPQLRANLVERHGVIPYKIGYSIASAVGLVVIYLGYTSAPYTWVWQPLPGSPFVTHGLMLIAAFFLVAADFPTSWGKRAKHPMMIGTLFWAIAHLWTNGHLKAILLFGCFGLYAIWLLIKADWKKSVKEQALWKNVLWIVASVLAYGLVRYLHTL